KRPRGSRADRSYDEQIVIACGEKPAYGYRRVTWWLRRKENLPVNRKRVLRVMRDSFLHNLPLLFRGSIYAWFPAHVASCWEALILPNSGVQFSGEHYIAFFPTLCSTRIASAKRSLSVLFIPF